MSINSITIGGRLSRDAELKFTPKGTAVASVSVANNRRWTTDSGEKKEEVTFVDVEMWGKTAEAFAKFHSKGSECLIQGRLKQETWDDKATGKKRSKIVVVAEQWHFVGGKRDGQAEGAAPAAKPANPVAGYDPLNGPQQPQDDDVPF